MGASLRVPLSTIALVEDLDMAAMAAVLLAGRGPRRLRFRGSGLTSGMALTPSTMRALGTPAPDFELPDVVTGKKVALGAYAARTPLLVIFLCRHCPYVVHVEKELARLGRDYAGAALRIVAISANDAAAYPDDAPEKLAEWARGLGFAFPLLYDETQETARAYDAACTPDFFVYTAAHRLAYRGQLDDSRPGNGVPVTGADLRAALDALLAGRPVATEQRPSMGCNIKWKARDVLE